MLHFTISRNALLKPLQLVAPIADKNQVMPILSNLLFKLEDTRLSMVASDRDVELNAYVMVEKAIKTGMATLPARKLFDIVRSLPEDSMLTFKEDQSKHKCILTAGRSRFVLATMKAQDFPFFDAPASEVEFNIFNKLLAKLINQVNFAQANQDVRYYLNGMLLEVAKSSVSVVATDGHRLAHASLNDPEIQLEKPAQIIIPRKTVFELMKLVADDDSSVDIAFSSKHIKVSNADMVMYSKLVEGRFPQYRTIISASDKPYTLNVSRETLKLALSRVLVFCSDKFHGARFHMHNHTLTITASNLEHEEVKEELEVDYDGPELELGLNVRYIMDVLSVVSEATISMKVKDPDATCYMAFEASGLLSQYIIMPMKL